MLSIAGFINPSVKLRHQFGVTSSRSLSLAKRQKSMRQLNLLMFAVALFLLLSGCMTTKEMNAIMDSWMGHNVNDLIAAWGPPNDTLSDGNGGQILVYDQSGQVVLPGTATTQCKLYFGQGFFDAMKDWGRQGTPNTDDYNKWQSGMDNLLYGNNMPGTAQQTKWVDTGGGFGFEDTTIEKPVQHDRQFFENSLRKNFPGIADATRPRRITTMNEQGHPVRSNTYDTQYKKLLQFLKRLDAYEAHMLKKGLDPGDYDPDFYIKREVATRFLGEYEAKRNALLRSK